MSEDLISVIMTAKLTLQSSWVNGFNFQMLHRKQMLDNNSVMVLGIFFNSSNFPYKT